MVVIFRHHQTQWGSDMPRNSDRPLASHVKVAIAAGQGKRTGQAKTSSQKCGRGIAAHVKAAIAAGRAAGQAKVGAPPSRSGELQMSARESKYKKTLDDYKSEYYEYLDDEYWAEEYLEDEYYSIEDIWSYAVGELGKKGYRNWNATDSSQGDYCRFIWFLGSGVTVGVNVHYTQGGKVAGNMYIKGIFGDSRPTPQLMVTRAPSNRPGTTRRWRDL